MTDEIRAAREQLVKLLNDAYYGVGHTAMPILDANLDLVRQALGGEPDFLPSGLSAHLSPGKRWLHSPHDKNSVHMDGCIPLYVRRDHLEARGVDLEGWLP